MLRSLSFLLFGVTIAASVATAHAGAGVILDPTGSWIGSIKCKGLVNGEKAKLNFDDQVLEISGGGETINAALSGASYRGKVYTHANDAGKAGLLLVLCETDPDQPQAEVVNASITTKKNGTMKLKGTGIAGALGQLLTCKFKFERTDETNPNVGECSSGDPT